MRVLNLETCTLLLSTQHLYQIEKEQYTIHFKQRIKIISKLVSAYIAIITLLSTQHLYQKETVTKQTHGNMRNTPRQVLRDNKF